MITLGIDLGGTKIAAALVDDGRILVQERVPTPQTGFPDVRDAMVAVAHRLLDGRDDVHAIGVGSPGPLDLAAGTILFAPNIPGMEDAPIVDALQARLERPVVLENDATGAQTEKHQKRMMGEIAKLLGSEKLGFLDPADYERTVDTLLANASTPVITKKPEGAWTHDITDEALK